MHRQTPETKHDKKTRHVECTTQRNLRIPLYFLKSAVSHEAKYTRLRTSFSFAAGAAREDMSDVATRPWRTPRFACRRSRTVMRQGVWKRSSCHAVTRKMPQFYHTALQDVKRGILKISVRERSEGGRRGDRTGVPRLQVQRCCGYGHQENAPDNRRSHANIIPHSSPFAPERTGD